MFKKILVVLILLTMATFLSQTMPSKAAENAFRISGSTTIQPLSDDAADLYSKKYGETLLVEGGGSGAGIKDAISGTSAIGAVSRSLNADEKAQLKYTTVAHDALVLIVNQNNPVNSLTKNNVIDIYTGKISNWKELGGADSPILLLTRENGGTLELFEKYTGLKDASSPEKGANGNITAKAVKLNSNYDAAQNIGDVPNSIAFSSYGSSLSFKEKGLPIKILVLDGVNATRDNIINNTYPVTRELNYVYKSTNAKTEKFLNLFSTPEGINLIKKQGFIP